MRLHEEFKLYETMWESLDTTAIVFVGNKPNEKALLNKVAKTNPAHTTTVYTATDFLRQYQNSKKEHVKFYFDTEGKAELEKICTNMPAGMKKAIFSGATLLEAQKAATSAFDETAFTACLNRVTANAAEYSEPDVDKFGGSIIVKLSEEDLKKALRIGSRGGYTDPSQGKTMPAQLVDMVSLEIARTDDEGICAINVEISGENEETGESTHDYNNGDIPFVGGKIIPGNPIESDDEFISYVMKNIVPNAEKLAHEIIEDTWNELGINDYSGITDYNSTEDTSEWVSLLTSADALLKKLIISSSNRNYDDGDGYWQSEYDTWCFRYLYHKDTLENTAQLDKLCNGYSKKLPNVEFYWSEDEGVSEIGYIATRDE